MVQSSPHAQSLPKFFISSRHTEYVVSLLTSETKMCRLVKQKKFKTLCKLCIFIGIFFFLPVSANSVASSSAYMQTCLCLSSPCRRSERRKHSTCRHYICTLLPVSSQTKNEGTNMTRLRKITGMYRNWVRLYLTIQIILLWTYPWHCAASLKRSFVVQIFSKSWHDDAFVLN